MNNAVSHADLEPDRPPVRGFQVSDNPLADVIVIRRGGR
jgi:hypothetical protein